MWVELMAVPVLSGEFLRGVGIAVFALVRASVVQPGVLAHQATTSRPQLFRIIYLKTIFSAKNLVKFFLLILWL